MVGARKAKTLAIASFRWDSSLVSVKHFVVRILNVWKLKELRAYKTGCEFTLDTVIAS